jgi:predicted nucleic acid-binding protein
LISSALAHGMGIATGNADEFQRIPGLRVIAAADAD